MPTIIMTLKVAPLAIGVGEGSTTSDISSHRCTAGPVERIFMEGPVEREHFGKDLFVVLHQLWLQVNDCCS